ncbi:MAG: HEAT repeat domain-containing protein, partial [Euryarchaeota archaeon]|nr:HEAT repeat domain-containing protein [Euryarchaeota archaeon]
KTAAWSDLHRLTSDEDRFVRSRAADALGAAFPHVSDKTAAWEDLYRLTNDKDRIVRQGAADVLGAAFPHIPDKTAAWSDLHRLTSDEDRFVRSRAADALGAAFPHVSDKTAAWEDLLDLAKDSDSDVRVSANHSLGRVSIFKATEAESEEGFRNELENALEFFESSAAEASVSNPSEFCLPFYRSFYVLTFKKEDAEAEVQRYLYEAKNASEGSKSKEDLLEAVENLANALREAQDLRVKSLEAVKRDLNVYRRYCDRAAELLDDTGETAPGATKLIRRGLPIIDHRIKEAIAEIQDKARAVCQQTLNTPAEDLGKEIVRESRLLSQVEDPIGLEKIVNNIQMVLEPLCNNVVGSGEVDVFKLLEKARTEQYLEGKLNLNSMVLSMLLAYTDRMKAPIGNENTQKIDPSSGSEEKTWYKDANTLIALGMLLIAATGLLIKVLM